MPCECRWIASVSTSALHVADLVRRQIPLVDPRLSPALLGPAQAFEEGLASVGLPPDRLRRQLLAWAHHWDNNRELASTALRKVTAWGPKWESVAARLGTLIGELEGALLRAVPGVVEELSHRSRPVRELWDARGPGLLRAVGLLTDERLLVEQADIVLVLPASGGGGEAQLLNNSVRLEAVLTNPREDLPEVIRLGWLISQLHCDVPAYSERIHVDRLPTIAALALVIPALVAAANVELVRSWEQALPVAWEVWRLPSPAGELQEILQTWWGTVQETRPAWGTALTALDQMLGERWPVENLGRA